MENMNTDVRVERVRRKFENLKVLIAQLVIASS